MGKPIGFHGGMLPPPVPALYLFFPPPCTTFHVSPRNEAE